MNDEILITSQRDDAVDPATAIAVIGMAGRYPGADDVHHFWRNLIDGKDTVTRFSLSELEVHTSAAQQPGYVAARGILQDIGLFDADFFAVNPREAAHMDPQHRLFLETCHNALESAGYVPQTYAGEIGLFAGCALNTYLLNNLAAQPDLLAELTANYQVGEFLALLGNDKDFLTSRVAYKLNLRGPVMSVQGACATSLVAVVQAAQSLSNFACDMALAGGVSVTFPQKRGHLPQEGGLSSADGVCRPFDAHAAGTVFSHGAGAVLLKRMDDALRDRDPIHAVIRGFAVNNDGAQKAGYMAPGIDGQSRVIAAAQAMAGISADTITYVEAHGTGTPLGDPIEVAALTRTFRDSTDRTAFCALSTAKGNVGHMDAAAGVTGLIKTTLQLEHRIIPGLAHFTAPNPELHLETTPFTLSAETKPWISEHPLRAGVSAFGVGGVNAHVIMEEAPLQASAASPRAAQTLCLSARSDDAARAAAANLAAHLEQHPAANLADVAFTLATGRREFPHRIAIAATDTADAITQLRNAKPVTAAARRTAMLFSGQGSQFIGMGRDLYATEPLFRDTIDALAPVAEEALGFDLRTLLYGSGGGDATRTLEETRYTQPALFITEFAIAKLLASWGVQPEVLAGHSLGEYTAAAVAGIFTPEAALRLVCLRGKLMQSCEPGAMLSVPFAEDKLAACITGNICIAGLNSPRASVLAGPVPEIDALAARLEAEGVAARKLRTSHAFHSAMMDPIIAEFEAAVAATPRNAPTLPILSTATGTWLTQAEATSPRYWADQIRKPVRFAAAVETLLTHGITLFIEAGPGEALTTLAGHQRSAKSSFAAVASMPLIRGTQTACPIQAALSELWCAGLTPDWTAYFAAEERRRTPLPTYPFERKLHWIGPTSAAPLTTSSAKEEPTMPTATLTDADRRPVLEAEVARVFTDLSGIPVTAADYATPFLELGFDSLFMTQATLSVQKAFGVKVTLRQLNESFSSVTALATHLDATLPAEACTPQPAATPVPTPTAPASGAALKGTGFSPSVEPPTMTGASAPEASNSFAQLTELFNRQLALLQAAAGASVSSTLATGKPATGPLVHESVAVPKYEVAKPLIVDAKDQNHGSFRPPVRVKQELTTQQLAFIDSLITRYTAKTPGSKAHTQSSRAVLADPRAVAGFRPQWKEIVYPLVTDRALGSRIWDIDGNEYIDIVNGYGCIMFGHSPEFVVVAAHQQLDTGVAIGPQSVLAGEVAEGIKALTGNERVTFCNTGSEAVMAAIRIARTVTGRDKFVYFAGDYHGTFDEVLMRHTPRGTAAIAPGIPADNTKNVVVLEYGTDASLRWIRDNAADIAAVLIEPVQTRHPDNKPFEFIRALRTLTEQHEIAFILDEVVTGFRIAPGGMQEFLGIRADMATYGKVIGGGHPIGVLAGKARYMDALDGGAWNFGDDSGPEVGVTFFAGTFVRHPLALAAARSVVAHLQQHGPALQQTLNAKTSQLATNLDAFFAAHGVPARIDHFSNWFYFLFPSEEKLASLFYYLLREKGIHIQEGYPCFLTTAHTDADIARIEQAFRETVIEMQAAGALSGSTDNLPPDAPQGPALHPFAKNDSPARTPMTEPQREVYLAAQLSDDANCAFNESVTVTLRGPVRLDALRFALDAVIARHDALRSVVCTDGEHLCFDPAYCGETQFIDLRHDSPAAQANTIAARKEHEARTPFDLNRGPLLRSVTFQLADDALVLILTGHHIVLDGWSANQLLEEIGRVYSDGAAALNTLAPLLPFSSYARRENDRAAAGAFVDNERFWVAQYAGRSPRLELPTDRPRPRTKTYAGSTLEGQLPSELLAPLKKLSAANGCSLFVTLLSSFQLLLHRLTRQTEVVTGISVAGQSMLEDASLVGHCVHFLPMLSEIAEDTTVAAHLKTTRAALFDAQDHQEFTYGSLLRKLKLEREPGRLPLIEVQFNLEKVGANAHFNGLDATIAPNPKRFVNTDLFLNVIEHADSLAFTCDYNTDLFDESTIARWLSHWTELLRSALADPTQKISDLALLTAAESHTLATAFNNTAADLGPFAAVSDLVLANAAAHPDRTAIECNGRRWSYAELAEYAHLIARRLVHEGLQPGELVGICIERSLEMAGAMLAVMLAGGAYVPLDPRHPRERLAQIIADAGMKLLLTGRDPSVETGARILDITGPQPKHTVALPASPAADAIAYVIYTSGSTGVPKGVAIQQSALVNLLRGIVQDIGFADDDTLVAVTTLSFDIAELEVLLPLITGGRLVIATDEQVTNGALLLRLLKDSRATMLQATPGGWRILLDAGWDATTPVKALCGGEALPRELADQLLDRASELWNVYGPTETTIWSSATRVERGTGPLRLGTPLPNQQFHVVDEHARVQPLGVTGELAIGGAGLALGYWHRDALTAEKFVATPLGRLYKTGDLARRLSDGTIELLGRADFQVKIRGYRIELGDIEAALAKHPSVREAIVLDHKPEGAPAAHLVAFIDCGAHSTDATLANELRALAERTLPPYMVPQHVLLLDGFPRLPNSKVNRRALKDLAAAGELTALAAREYVAPATPEEQTLATIWAELLSLPRVGVTDSIFELGADSLAIFRIAARAQREGLALKAAAIFEHRTVRALCAALFTKAPEAGAPAAAAASPRRITAAARTVYKPAGAAR